MRFLLATAGSKLSSHFGFEDWPGTYFFEGDLVVFDSKSERMIEVANPDFHDYHDHLYLLSYDDHTGWDLAVFADHGDEVLDIAMDYAVEMGWTGLYTDEEPEWPDEHFQAGNYGYWWTSPAHEISIKRLS